MQKLFAVTFSIMASDLYCNLKSLVVSAQGKEVEKIEMERERIQRYFQLEENGF